jgi:PAS domain S-box-containing protein
MSTEPTPLHPSSPPLTQGGAQNECLSPDELLARTLASEERYRALVEASTLMVWESDAAGQVEDMPVWRELTGQTVEQVRGSGWTNAIHPDDRKRVARIWDDAIASRSVYEAQYRLMLRDGSYRWYRARGVPLFTPDGGIRQWVGVFNEIDRLMRRDEGMRFLAEASATLTASLDERSTLEALATLAVDNLADGAMVTLVRPDGTFEHVTTRSRDGVTAAFAAETERMYPLPPNASSGYPRAIRTGEPELVPEGAFDERILPDVAADEIHLERLRRLQMYSAMVVPITARGATMGAITLVLHGSMRRRPFDATDLALATELGRRAGLALDNSRLFAAERAARDDAVRANRAKSDLLAKVSHETRQPVHATIGWLETLEMGLHGELAPTQRDALRRVRQNQDRLLGVINDLLDISRIEAGRLDVRLQDVVVREMMDAVESAVVPQMREKELACEFRHPPATVMVRADRDQLIGVLTNLLGNAAKFTPARGRVALTYELDQHEVRLVVEDSGIGIPAEFLERVFEPFFQVESGFTRTTAGTGLGLSIAREAARAMGGDVTVTSRVGDGSRFTVTLQRAW